MLHCRKVKRQGQAQLNTRKSSSDKASLEAQSNITLKLLQCCFASFDLQNIACRAFWEKQMPAMRLNSCSSERTSKASTVKGDA